MRSTYWLNGQSQRLQETLDERISQSTGQTVALLWKSVPGFKIGEMSSNSSWPLPPQIPRLKKMVWAFRHHVIIISGTLHDLGLRCKLHVTRNNGNFRRTVKLDMFTLKGSYYIYLHSVDILSRWVLYIVYINQFLGIKISKN